MPASKPKKGICPYCASHTKLTKDHVIPQCMFVEPPPDFIHVNACSHCNAEKSKYDVDLRDFTAVDIYSAEHPVARELLKGTIARSIKGNHGQISHLFSSESMIHALSSAGSQELEMLKITRPQDRVRIALEYVIRGLYFFDKKVPLPVQTSFKFKRHVQEDYQQLRSDISGDRWRSHKIGDVFFTRYLLGPADQPAGIYIMQFYGVIISAQFD